jgi:hypothetical protein
VDKTTKLRCPSEAVQYCCLYRPSRHIFLFAMSTLPYVQDPELHEFYNYGPFKESTTDLQSAPTVYIDRKSNEQFQNDIEDSDDVDDQSEVPSMTRGSSSRSASSSIIICPCENSSEKCQCQSTSGRAFSDMEFTYVLNCPIKLCGKLLLSWF